MSDRPIQKGDIAVVIRATPCCNSASSIGHIFTVEAIRNEKRHCIYCLRPFSGTVAIAANGEHKGQGCLVSRIKRIPPLSESEGIETKEELTA